eukprot:COSAG02_NODE_13662_length_1365_cov_6.841232_1_plen_90_part_00
MNLTGPERARVADGRMHANRLYSPRLVCPWHRHRGFAEVLIDGHRSTNHLDSAERMHKAAAPRVPSVLAGRAKARTKASMEEVSDLTGL